MTARTHDVAALTALILYVIAVPPESLTVATGLTAILANQLGGIAPDIDQPTAPFWRNLPIGRYFGRIFGALVGGHRFISHSLVGFAVFGVGALLLLEFIRPLLPNVDLSFVWAAFMLGIFSHLVMDTLTKEGVPWLLPLPYKIGIPPVRSWRITTGKKMEMLVVLPLLIVITTWLCAVNYNEIALLLQNNLTKT
jgi:inner membrane protein